MLILYLFFLFFHPSFLSLATGFTCVSTIISNVFLTYFQENQDKLHKEIDQYQHELTALQSSYSQKISTLNKRHKQELQKWQGEKEEYAQRIEELEEQLLQQEQHGVLYLIVCLVQCFSPLLVQFPFLCHPIAFFSLGSTLT